MNTPTYQALPTLGRHAHEYDDTCEAFAGLTSGQTHVRGSRLHVTASYIGRHESIA